MLSGKGSWNLKSWFWKLLFSWATLKSQLQSSLCLFPQNSQIHPYIVQNYRSNHPSWYITFSFAHQTYQMKKILWKHHHSITVFSLQSNISYWKKTLSNYILVDLFSLIFSPKSHLQFLNSRLTLSDTPDRKGTKEEKKNSEHHKSWEITGHKAKKESVLTNLGNTNEIKRTIALINRAMGIPKTGDRIGNRLGGADGRQGNPNGFSAG